MLLGSCGEYYKVQKSTDVSERYSFAKKSYNEKRYTRVVSLMEDVLAALSGTVEGPQSTYIMADACYNLKRREEATRYFQTYYTSYPKGEMVEEARYKAGLCLFESAPDPKLDQTDSYAAITELQGYLDFFPDGRYRKEVEQMLFDLQDRLAYKEFLAARLYMNLGLYMGNNYQSCIITAQNALKDYPYTRHKEELMFLIFRAKTEEAELSVVERQQVRLRDALDYYYTFMNEYPEGKYAKTAQKMYESLSKKIEKA